MLSWQFNSYKQNHYTNKIKTPSAGMPFEIGDEAPTEVGSIS